MCKYVSEFDNLQGCVTMPVFILLCFFLLFYVQTLEEEQRTFLTGNDLVQMKKFTLALISTEAELQAKK